MNLDFTGKVAIVTGGTRGIGAAICEELANSGAKVYATGTNLESVDKLNAKLTDDSPIRYLHLDFLDAESIEHASRQISGFTRVDILINNAGINKINPVDQILEDDWDRIMEVNLKGVYLITKWVSAKMKQQKSGRIVNIASIFGVVSKAKRAAYSTTKFGLLGYTKAAALDLGAYNILVNAVSPGFVLTELTQSILSKTEMKQLSEQVPLGRFAQPGEIAKTVLFLASDANTYISGQNLIIDGGFVSA